MVNSHLLVKRREISLRRGNGPDWRSTLGRKASYFLLQLPVRFRGKRMKKTSYLGVALSNRLLPFSYRFPSSSSKRTLTGIAMFQPTVGLFWKGCLLCLVAFSCPKGRHKASGADPVRSHTKRASKSSAATVQSALRKCSTQGPAERLNLELTKYTPPMSHGSHGLMPIRRVSVSAQLRICPQGATIGETKSRLPLQSLQLLQFSDDHCPFFDRSTQI